MVAELRAARLDINARVKFTPDKEPVTESRAVVEELLAEPDELAAVAAGRTADKLAGAAGHGWVEVG